MVMVGDGLRAIPSCVFGSPGALWGDTKRRFEYAESKCEDRRCLPFRLALLGDKTASEAQHRRRASRPMRIHSEGCWRLQELPFPCTSRHACACVLDVGHPTNVRVGL